MCAYESPELDAPDTLLDPFDEVTPVADFRLLDDSDTPIMLATRKLSLGTGADLAEDSGPVISSALPPVLDDLVEYEGREHDDEFENVEELAGGADLVAAEGGSAGDDSRFESSSPAATPVAAGGGHPIDTAKPWASAAKNRRPLPQPAKMALLGGGFLVLLVVASSRCGATSGAAGRSSTVVYHDLSVSQESLRKRTELTRDDFAVNISSKDAAMERLRQAEAAARPSAGLEPATPEATELEDELAQRRRRRGDNPEDVRSAAGRRRKGGEPKDSEPKVYVPTVHRLNRAPEPSARGRDKSGSSSQSSILVPAGDTRRARLIRSATLRTGAETVVAEVSGDGLPKGTKAIGRATLREDHAVVRFSKLVLPGGEEVRCDAEAQDLSGDLHVDEPDDGSVTGDVARGTTERVIDGLSGGLVGGAASDAARSRDRRSRHGGRRQVTLTLSKGERFKIFFLAAATVR